MKKIKFSRKCKILKKAIKKSVKIDKYFIRRSLLVAFSAAYLAMYSGPALNTLKLLVSKVQHLVEAKESISEMRSSLDLPEDASNSDILNAMLEDTIVCGEFILDLDQTYEVKDEILYDHDGNIADLTGSEKTLVFAIAKVNEKTLDTMNLKKSKTQGIILDNTCITDEFVTYLPETVEAISLNGCNFITDLSELPKYAPNISYIYLENLTKLNNLDFLREFENLEFVSIKDTLCVTEDILDYLSSKGVTIESNGKELENNKKLDSILDEIITNDMEDEEKITTVTDYVLDTITYDGSKSTESNASPIDQALTGRAVCISYAELMTVLLNKLGINTYTVTSTDHGWCLIELDGNYYYVDPTNLDSEFVFSLTYKLFKSSPYYMSNPNYCLFSQMKAPDSDKAIIPSELAEDILSGADDQKLMEKYGSTIGAATLWLISIAMSCLFWFNIDVTLETLDDAYWCVWSIMYDYKSKCKKEKSSKKRLKK